MKRTALKRKTPMKRSRKPLPRMSAKKAAWQPRYREMLTEARREQQQERGHGYCRRCGRECDPEPHHIWGRIGAWILAFVLICRTCHRFIHDNPRKARETGWLGKAA